MVYKARNTGGVGQRLSPKSKKSHPVDNFYTYKLRTLVRKKK